MNKKLGVTLLVILISIIGIYFLFTTQTNQVKDIEDSYQFSTIDFQGTRFDIATIEQNNIGLINFYYKDLNAQGFSSITSLKKWLSEQEKKLIFVTNGGIFDTNYSPLGLYIENSKEVSKINTSTGEGNFYLQPNGVFMIKNGEGEIVETSNYTFSPNISFATQSGPLLVINNEINPLFGKSSQNKYTRSGVGISQNGSILFVLSNEPVTFYDIASVFKDKLGVQNALYLDGAISEMYVPRYREKTKQNFSVMIGILKK